MRRGQTITVLLVTVALLLTTVAGVAIAEDVYCDSTPPCYGTPEGDEMTGTASGETIYGYGGDDNVYADAGNDTIYGGPDGDGTLTGEGGSDTIYGQGGADDIDLSFFDSAGSTDYGYGGGGNDWVYANDSNVDIINCGKGTDRVFYDEGIDTIRSCEIRFPS